MYPKEWWPERRGKVTGSVMHTVIHGTPRGWSSLMDRLAAEALMDEPPDRDYGEFDARAWGDAKEAAAIANYELDYGFEVHRPGFVKHPTMAMVGCTIDGLVVGEKRGVEVKCPKNPERFDVVAVSQRVPREYIAQTQAEIWVCELDVLDFICFDPRRPHPAGMVVIPVYRDDDYIALMEHKVHEFLSYYTAGKRPAAKVAVGVPSIF